MQVLQESYEHKDTLWDNYECPKFIPFNPVDKYTIAIIRDKQSGEMMRIMKGAPQVTLHAYTAGAIVITTHSPLLAVFAYTCIDSPGTEYVLLHVILQGMSDMKA